MNKDTEEKRRKIERKKQGRKRPSNFSDEL